MSETRRIENSAAMLSEILGYEVEHKEYQKLLMDLFIKYEALAAKNAELEKALKDYVNNDNGAFDNDNRVMLMKSKIAELEETINQMRIRRREYTEEVLRLQSKNAELEKALAERDDFIEVRGRHVIELADERDKYKQALNKIKRGVDPIHYSQSQHVPYASHEQLRTWAGQALADETKEVKCE